MLTIEKESSKHNRYWVNKQKYQKVEIHIKAENMLT
jgi:hypothetical protein